MTETRHRSLERLSLLDLRTPELRDRLRAIAVDVDRMWQAALNLGDFDLVTRTTEASHALHRALLALDEGEVTIG
jgi:hypothetical protein